MTFWIVAAGIGLAVAALLLSALLRGRAGAEPAAAYDLRVYRDQLGEIERDVARGLVARLERDQGRGGWRRAARRGSSRVRRRRARQQAAWGPRRAGRRWPWRAGCGRRCWGASGSMRGGGAGLSRHAHGRAPGTGRGAAPRASGPGRGRGRARGGARRGGRPGFLELMDKLGARFGRGRTTCRGTSCWPGTRRRWAISRPPRRRSARSSRSGGPRPRARITRRWPRVMILAAGGYVSPEAEAELMTALQRDPLNGTATYYAGLMSAQLGRPRRAFSLWAPLLERSAPATPGWRRSGRRSRRSRPRGAVALSAAAGAGRARHRPARPQRRTGGGGGRDDAGRAAGDDRGDGCAAERAACHRGRLGRGMGATDRGLWRAGPDERAGAIWTEAQARFAGRAEDLPRSGPPRCRPEWRSERA